MYNRIKFRNLTKKKIEKNETLNLGGDKFGHAYTLKMRQFLVGRQQQNRTKTRHSVTAP